MKTKFKKNGRRLLAAILCLVMAVMALPMSAFAWTSEEGVKGIFQNNSGNVVSVLSKQEWFTKQSEGFVEETFNGSLPQFLVAFTRRKKLSKQEIAEIQKIIDQNVEE